MNKIYLMFRITSFLFLAAAMQASAQFRISGKTIAMDSSCFQLTDVNGTYEAGGLWNTIPVDLQNPFDLHCQLYFGTNDASGADGIVFLLHNDTANFSKGLTKGGYIGFSGISPSLGVTFDTWYNDIHYDPANDHLAIQRNGDVVHGTANELAGPVDISSTSANVEDGLYHQARITWDPAAQKIAVYVDCIPRLSYTGDIVSSIFGGNSLVYWGFTAATGISINTQRVCLQNISFAAGVLRDTIICQGQYVQLHPATGGVSYSWSPSTALSNPAIANPFAYPQQTTKYIVTITDSCGNQSLDSLTINVGNNIPTPTITRKGMTLYCQTDSSYVSYQWYNGNTMLPGETDTSLVISAGGNYNVEVTSKDGCKIAVGINVVLGIQQSIMDGSVRLSPNPASDKINISFSLNTVSDITLSFFDIAGRIIYKTDYPSLTNHFLEDISTASFAKGIYLLQIKAGGESYNRKIVIQ